ncbi:MAG: MipA/OmpV family protein [Arenicellales bacterium]
MPEHNLKPYRNFCVKNNSLKLLLFTVMILFFGKVANAAEVIVRIDNPPESGTVALALFNTANSFADLRDPVRVVKHSLDGSEEYKIDNVEAGEYALLVYFDENANDRIDKNFIGIPKEPLGFSNRYLPKGPPSYKRARFQIQQGESRTFDVELYRPLGKYGRIGMGVGVIARSSPYRDYDGTVSQVIPAITYNGERLQIYGPRIQFGLVGSGKLRLAATGEYRIGPYDEDDSDYLEGMGDRSDTFMGGLAIQAVLPAGFGLTGRYQHDLLGRVGGGEARIVLDKTLQFGIVRISPEIALTWASADISNHDYGVPDDKATAARPAYTLGDTYSTEIGLGMFIEITRDWLFIMNVASESLSDEVTASPIVSEDYVIKGFAAINYVF